MNAGGAEGLPDSSGGGAGEGDGAEDSAVSVSF